MFGDAKTLVGANEALTDVELLVAYAKKSETIRAKAEGCIHVKGYVDIAPDHWAAKEIYQLSDKGIIGGVDHVRYVPNQLVKHGEVTDFLAKALNVDQVTVEKAIGLIGSEPKSPFTREEMALAMKWIYETKTGKQLTSTEVSSFSDDAQITAGAKTAVSSLAKAGLLSGRPGNLFAPKEAATRAEVAHVISTLLNQ